MANRAPFLTIAAIIAVCAALGLLDSVNGALMLAPFLLLVAPLLAGIDPAAPAVDTLIDFLDLEEHPGPAVPGLALVTLVWLRPGLVVLKRLRARGPPAPGFA